MSTTNVVPEKQDVQNVDVPVMSPPPRAYAPVIKDESTSGPRKITPLRRLQKQQAGPDPEWVNCPFCKQTSTIRRVAEPSDEAKCLTICCCFLGILRPLIFLCLAKPDWLENIDVHCASCGKHLATVPPDGEVQVVRVPEGQQRREQLLQQASKKQPPRS